MALPADDSDDNDNYGPRALSSHRDSHVGSVSPAATRTRTLALTRTRTRTRTLTLARPPSLPLTPTRTRTLTFATVRAGETSGWLPVVW